MTRSRSPLLLMQKKSKLKIYLYQFKIATLKCKLYNLKTTNISAHILIIENDPPQPWPLLLQFVMVFKSDAAEQGQCKAKRIGGSYKKGKLDFQRKGEAHKEGRTDMMMRNQQ